mmetsp:Transcript_43720/g.76685  ORF Transcript_43720/g.76685 Transcript_43720/m.76685 type:complete len:408 (-) Transcript_43720:63-1286(-)
MIASMGNAMHSKKARTVKDDVRSLNEPSWQVPYHAPSALVDSAVGCLLGHMIGDALGTCTEGWPPKQIRKLAGTKEGLIRDFIPCIHMGQGRYVGPPRPGDEGEARCGMYSDDTNTALALASSLVENGGLDGPLTARKYAEFFFDGSCPTRFCPPTAMRVLQDVVEGVDYKMTGLPPYFAFDGGSFANGGAMRASPLGIAFRSASTPQMRRAAEEAVRSSHAHPEAVDGAALQAASVAFAAKLGIAGRAAEFDPATFLGEMQAVVTTSAFKTRLAAVKTAVSKITRTTNDVQVCQDLLDDGIEKPGSGFGFQIAAVDLMPCVLWIVARYHAAPEEAIMRAVSLGGDTDTVACLVGATLGALHGTKWIPERWWKGVENDKRGRDYAVNLAEQLAKLDLQEPVTWGGDA